jgi:hydrogenase/urease accessory protein HupE
MNARGRPVQVHLFRIVAMLFVLLLPAPALAHAVGLSQARYALQDGRLEIDMVLSRSELKGLVPAFAEEETLTQSMLDDHAPELAQSFAEGFLIKNRDAANAAATVPCSVKPKGAALTDGDGVRVVFVGECAAQTVSINVTAIEKLSHGHRQVATVIGGSSAAAQSTELVLFRGNTTIELSRTRVASGISHTAAGAEQQGTSFFGFVRMGVEHILTGYDHLLFVFALLLLGGNFRSLALVITSFTLSHSIALALAVLGVVSPSTRFVEPAIALSIAYVGVENCAFPEAKKRWRLTLLFGFVHGFGFAGALQEISLPAPRIPAALVGFNLGVEAGQLATLAIVLPLILWLRKSEAFRTNGVRALSAGVTGMGIVWFVQRTFFS